MTTQSPPTASEAAGATPTPRTDAPANSLPSHGECALRVGNSEHIDKRVAEGGYGNEYGVPVASELHKFIYEYDDADPYRSAWFLHRLERLLDETKKDATAASLRELSAARQRIFEDREKVASMILRLCFATGHGDTIDDLLAELEAQVLEKREIARQRIEGLEAEREQWRAEAGFANPLRESNDELQTQVAILTARAESAESRLAAVEAELALSRQQLDAHIDVLRQTQKERDAIRLATIEEAAKVCDIAEIESDNTQRAVRGGEQLVAAGAVKQAQKLASAIRHLKESKEES